MCPFVLACIGQHQCDSMEQAMILLEAHSRSSFVSHFGAPGQPSPATSVIPVNLASNFGAPVHLASNFGGPTQPSPATSQKLCKNKNTRTLTSSSKKLSSGDGLCVYGCRSPVFQKKVIGRIQESMLPSGPLALSRFGFQCGFQVRFRVGVEPEHARNLLGCTHKKRHVIQCFFEGSGMGRRQRIPRTHCGTWNPKPYNLKPCRECVGGWWWSMLKPRMWERRGVQLQLAPTLDELLLLPFACKKKDTEESCT